MELSCRVLLQAVWVRSSAEGLRGDSCLPGAGGDGDGLHRDEHHDENHTVQALGAEVTNGKRCLIVV